jgi:uncharacterized membrane protein (UPF0127 family)
MNDEKPIINVTRGTVVCERAALADRAPARMRGLLGRDGLRPGQALLLQPAPSIHTAFMRFPIDVVFLDRESVVVRVVPALPPWRAASAPKARSVLELAAGEAARRGVQEGDWLIRVSDELVWNGADGPCQMGDAVAVDSAGYSMVHAEPPLPPSGEVAARGGCDVLLVSRDRRFRAVMAVVLSGRGLSVVPSSSYPDPAGAEFRADVVVIDAGDSLADAERAAAQAGLMPADGTVVFVTDVKPGVGGMGSTPRVVGKWEPVERLCGAITAARTACRGRAS